MKQTSKTCTFHLPATITILVAVLAVTAVPSWANCCAGHEAKAGMMQPTQQHPALMKAVMANPHHALAMGFRKNLLVFARTLQHMARQGDSLPPDFARTAVAEMKRSADLLDQEHAEMLRTLPQDVKGDLGDLPKMMQKHLDDVKGRIGQLNELVKGDRIDSKQVVQHLQPLLDDCRRMGMGGMHGAVAGQQGMGMHHHGMMAEKQAQDAELANLVTKMNAAPADRKVDILADIVSRLVTQRTEMHRFGGGMPGASPHGMPHHPHMGCTCPCCAGQSADAEDDQDESMDEGPTE